MNAIQRFIGRNCMRAMKYAGIPLRDKGLIDLFGIRTNQSGVIVDEHTANTFSAYYSGVTLLSNVVSMLPTSVYETDGRGGFKKCDLHSGTRLFKNRCNANSTAICTKEMIQRSMVTWGNGYAKIERVTDDNYGPPVGIWPLPPDQVQPTYDTNGEKIYKFNARFEGEKNEIYKDHEIIHIPGMGFDGLQGQSVVTLANQSIGLGLATELYGASFFGNNATPGGVLTHPGELDDIGEQNLAREWEKKLKGPYKAKRLVVLDEGMKYQPIGIPPEDSQFLQTRQFQVREIARWLRIPPHMLFDMEGATFSNIENLSLEFLIYCIQPWLTRWIQELNVKLLTEAEQETHTFSFDVSELLRMDMKTRYEVYSTGRNMGIMTLNDILRAEGKPTLDPSIGDMRITPSTMKVLGSSDPYTAIPPDIMQKAFDTIKAMSDGGKNPVKWEHACFMLNAMMPSANDEMITGFLRTLADNKCVKVVSQTPKE